MPIAEALQHLQPDSIQPFSRLLDLPTELLLIISENCCFNSEISLRQSCRTMYNVSRTLCAHLRPRACTVDVYFERLCMDDEYKMRHWARAVCSVCKMCHATTDFSLQQLKCNPVERVCKGAQRLLFVTPDTYWSCRELLQKLDGSIVHLSPNPPDYGLSCVLKRLERYAGISPCWIIAIEWSINLQDDLTVQPLVVICPHMDSAHPRIRRAVDRLRKAARHDIRSEWRDACSLQSRVRCVTCDDCGEADCLEIMWFGSDWGKIQFHARRVLGRLVRPGCETIWMRQSQGPFGDGT